MVYDRHTTIPSSGMPLSPREGTAAELTESYISQLLTRKKLPPAPDQTDIYEKLDKALKLLNGELAKLALAQRMDALKRNYEEPRGALLKETRKLILRKCVAAR